MPYRNIYFREEEITHIKSKPEGYMRKLIQADMIRNGIDPFQKPKKRLTILERLRGWIYAK
jgi:hypothetical protein